MRKRGDRRSESPAARAEPRPPVAPTETRPSAADGRRSPVPSEDLGRLIDRVVTLKASVASQLESLSAELVTLETGHRSRIAQIESTPPIVRRAEDEFNAAIQRSGPISESRVQSLVNEGKAQGVEPDRGRPVDAQLSAACREMTVAASAMQQVTSILRRFRAPAKIRALGAAFKNVEACWNLQMEQCFEAEYLAFEKASNGISERKNEARSQLTRDRPAFDDAFRKASKDFPSFRSPTWAAYAVPPELPNAVRLGEYVIENAVDVLRLPALWRFPRSRSLLISTNGASIPMLAPQILSIVLQLVAAMPRGAIEVRFADPAGLGNYVAPFMQLREYDKSIIHAEVAVSEPDIDTATTELISRIGTVNASYLKGKFGTIEEHNLEAGEVAVAYRLLVAVGYPINFSQRAVDNICNIAKSGAKAGVFVVVLHDADRALPHGVDDASLKAAAHWIRPIGIPKYTVDGSRSGESIRLADTMPTAQGVAIEFDNAIDFRVGSRPEDTVFGVLVDRIGEAARASRTRVITIGDLWTRHRDAVTRNPRLFEGAPTPPLLHDEATWWKASSSAGIEVPIGQVGATKVQRYRVVEHQHAHTLIVGGTGTGKSTLLHGMIAALTTTYSPEELQLSLVDMKDGVGFNIYATKGPLPHAITIAVKADRSVTLDILESLVSEMSRRYELFKNESNRVGKAVDDLKGFRASSGTTLPRHFVIIDEFHDLTGPDDQIGQRARDFIKTLAKESRAAGVHMILSTQNVMGAGLGKDTLSEVAVRICFRLGDQLASESALGDGNYGAVEDLPASEAGVAIYNLDRLRSGNEVFKAALVSKESDVPGLVGRLAARWSESGRRTATRVFDGDQPADLLLDPAVLTALEWSDVGVGRSSSEARSDTTVSEASRGVKVREMKTRRVSSDPPPPSSISSEGFLVCGDHTID
jgi:hypothetical protein